MHYKESSIPYLKDKLKIQNIHRLPKLKKIVLNIGLGDAKDNANTIKNTISELTLISGQKPVTAYAKKPISNINLPFFFIKLEAPLITFVIPAKPSSPPSNAIFGS